VRRTGPRDMSVVERLPVWIKAAGNREAVLRAIGHLYLRLPQASASRGCSPDGHLTAGVQGAAGGGFDVGQAQGDLLAEHLG
jgi:hypothetical protein